MNWQTKAWITIALVSLPLVLLGGSKEFEIEKISEFQFSEEKELIAYPMSFCVTEDELFLVIDIKMGHIKLYDNRGKLIKILGKKGFGPTEFIKPGVSFYEEGIYGVLDFGSRRIHLYRRTSKKTHFKRFKTFFSYTSSSDLHMRGNKVFLAGYRAGENNESYEFISIDSETNQIDLLMPSFHKYGFSSFREYNAKIYSREIDLIGARALFDIAGDSAYYVWEGNLSIVRINLTTKQITRFGHKTPNYLRPVANKALENAYNSRYNNKMAYADSRKKMSLVHAILACPDYVMVIYRGPIRKESLLPYTVQFYTLEGEFLNELRLPPYDWSRFFLEKKKHILYGLARSADQDKPDEDEKYVMVKMKINKATR